MSSIIVSYARYCCSPYSLPRRVSNTLQMCRTAFSCVSKNGTNWHPPSSPCSLSRIPRGAEIQGAYEFKGIVAPHAKVIAYVRQVAIRAPSPGLRYLCGHYVPPTTVFKGICYQEWITTYFFYFIISEIRSISVVDHVRDQRDINFLLKEKSGLNRILLRPVRKCVASITDLVVHFDGYFSIAALANVLKPLPKFGNAFDRVVIPVCIDENICVQQ